MEVVGAVLATIAIHAAGESLKPWLPDVFRGTDDAGETQR